MSAVPNLQVAPMTQELPLLTACMVGGALDDLYYRLILWELPQFIALQAEVKGFYLCVRGGMEAAAQDAKVQRSVAEHSQVEHVLREGVTELDCFCSFVEACIELHLKRLEAQS